jgi:hypothetical protein
MFNPLAKDPATLSTDELQEKINDLQKKYITASRFSDQSLLLQVQQTLTMYMNEQQKRSREDLLKQQQQSNDGEDLDSLINVN